MDELVNTSKTFSEALPPFLNGDGAALNNLEALALAEVRDTAQLMSLASKHVTKVFETTLLILVRCSSPSHNCVATSVTTAPSLKLQKR